MIGVIGRDIQLLKMCPYILICSFLSIFQARGLKKHLKRLNAPKHWMLDKLGGAFVCTSFTVHVSIILLYLFLFLISIWTHVLNWCGCAGTKAIIWTPQVKGVLAFDPHPAKQTKVCSNI